WNCWNTPPNSCSNAHEKRPPDVALRSIKEITFRNRYGNHDRLEGRMLGEKIGESTGKVTTRRILPNPNGMINVETSFMASGVMLGSEIRENGTYTATQRPDGTLFGTGQGLVISTDGEMLTWSGQGVGSIKKGGVVSYRGALFYQTNSSKWSRLNT